MQDDVRSNQRKTRVESFRLVVASMPASLAQNSAGCPEGFSQCRIQRVGAGSFRLDFNTAFARVPQIQITPLHATLSLKPILTTRTASSITWLVKNDAGAATDPTEMDVIVVGRDSADQQ